MKIEESVKTTITKQALQRILNRMTQQSAHWHDDDIDDTHAQIVAAVSTILRRNHHTGNNIAGAIPVGDFDVSIKGPNCNSTTPVTNNDWADATYDLLTHVGMAVHNAIRREILKEIIQNGHTEGEQDGYKWKVVPKW